MATSARARKAKTPAPSADGLPRPVGEFLGIALLAVGGLMLGGLFSYQLGAGTLMGPVGRLAAGALYASFGMGAYLVTLGVLALGLKALLGQRMEMRLGEGIGFTVATIAGCVLLHITFPRYRVHGYTAGGLTGELLGEVSLGLFHRAGTYLVALAVMCVGLLASTPLSTSHLIKGVRYVGMGAKAVAQYLWEGAAGLVQAQREAFDEAREAYEAEHGDDYDAEAEEDWDEDEEAEEVDDTEEAAEDEEEAEEEELDEDEDEEEEAEDDEAEDAEVIELAPKKGRKSPRDGKGSPRKNRRKSAASAKPAPKAATKKVAKPQKSAQAPEEEPEIVMPAEVPTPAAQARPGKKAPPRPEDLAAANSGPANGKPAPKSGEGSGKDSPMPGVVKLKDGPFELPPLELFEVQDKAVNEVDKGFVLEQAERLVTALSEFKIRGKVTKIHPGPVITRYEFKPEAGVKLSKIESLESDIAMALEAIRIRILAPIPGKATVGFEVPNKSRETVYIKEILGDEHFPGKFRLPMTLGKDITGKPRSLDMAKAPHLLVAGATGSGKSVGVNSMICSLLYNCSPDDVRMIMIDPKMLELSIYEGIPHLLLPVVTDPEKANLALRWAVQEMERRYAMLSAAQVRDIAGYNKKLPELVKDWEGDVKLAEQMAAESAAAVAEDGEEAVPGSQLSGISVDGTGGHANVVGGTELPDKPTKMPYVVVVIDEFADLMMVASKEVEQNVSRIAAKARAAGIHLILATQRPSVDVITGTIKNNFPSRIAFQVTSDADSRTILDGKGAKQLLGMGDMLYMERGGEPQRVHGCFVSEDEILKVVKFVKTQAKPVYNMDIVKKTDEGGEGPDRDESFDPLYDKAVQIVAEAQKVSTSMLQRRLNVGYNRAAKIVEKMEEEGAIGPSRGTTPREVFVSAA